MHSRLPAKSLFTGCRAGLPETELFEMASNSRAVVSAHARRDRCPAHEDFRDQGAEDALPAVIGGHSGIAQFENLAFGIMAPLLVRLDQDKADDQVRRIDRHP